MVCYRCLIEWLVIELQWQIDSESCKKFEEGKQIRIIHILNPDHEGYGLIPLVMLYFNNINSVQVQVLVQQLSITAKTHVFDRGISLCKHSYAQPLLLQATKLTDKTTSSYQMKEVTHLTAVSLGVFINLCHGNIGVKLIPIFLHEE